MTAQPTSFSPLARLLHWLMAPLVVAMLFIGIGMVATLSSWHQVLLSIHRPLGIAILVLAVIRLIVRVTRRTPALPSDMPAWQRGLAHGSHWLFYALLPLVGWSMLSAGGYPVQLAGSVYLPPIVPHDVHLYTFLRAAHTYLALLLFATFLMHLGAALFHGLIRRDGVFSSMTTGARAAGQD
jgi:cytochrome b561